MVDEIKRQILAKLEAVEREFEAHILFAIESGSRAWGFASPDSDYDVRFVYARQIDWYLSIQDRRDVIELPIENVLDINGWDVRKALQLLIKPNPVLYEWLFSPIIYRADQPAFEALKALARETLIERPATHHYLHLGEGQWRRFLEGRETVPLKKYFYSLRPALALRWLRLQEENHVPMDLPTLIAGAELPTAVTDFLNDLMAKKAATKELGEGPRIDVLDELILEEFRLARQRVMATQSPRGIESDLTQRADDLFRDIVKA